MLGRAIACGKVAPPIPHLAGWIGSEGQLSFVPRPRAQRFEVSNAFNF